MFNDAIDGGHIDVVIPVYNEEAILMSSISSLTAYLAQHVPMQWRVIIADNASTDNTWSIAKQLCDTMSGVSAIHLDNKGRGRALKHVWSTSTADVVAYMDVDLSTNLDSFLPLVAPLLSGHSQVAIGNRLVKAAHTRRKWKREFLSRGYNSLIRLGFRPKFSDAQCGFKALRSDVAHQLLPHIHDTGWFFDTELLLLADRCDLRIFEVPVDWIEDLDSRVHLPSTIKDDLKGLWRMKRSFWKGVPDLSEVIIGHQPQVAA